MLTRQDIENVAARFRADRPQYERVVSEVHTRTVRLLDGRALKSVVTSRAKSVDSLKRSLWRDREKWSPEQFEHSLAPPLVDLAGVRVLLYQDSDVEPARDALLEMFPTLRRKDKRSADAYSAYHLVVHEWCSDDDPAAAAIVRDRFDQDAAHRDVGLVAVMLLPAFLAEDVRDAIGPAPMAPLWKFMLRVVSSESGGRI